MAHVFTMPMLGNTMEEGTIVQWFKQVGDTVKKGEPLLEVMSDKANFEVEAEHDGVLRAILAEADATVAVHAPIALIGTADEPIDVAAAVGGAAPSQAAQAPVAEVPVAAAPAAAAVPSDGKVAASPRARKLAEEKGVDVATVAGSGPGGRVLAADVAAHEAQPAVRATPLAAKLADDLGVKLDALGAQGKVTAEDVRRAAEAARPAAAPPAPKAAGEPAVAEIIPFKGLRKLTADTVTRSRQTAPHICLNMEVDMTAAKALHAQLVPRVQETYGVKLTITDLLVKAVAKALAGHPLCNAALIGDEIRLYADRNIGVAVAAPNGLVVPVIRQADTLTLPEISAQLKGLVARCREGKQTQEDIAGGTFTITNIGMFGVDSFDPIIVPPQSCILGVCRVAEKPVVVDGQIVVRSMMNLCLSCDHRVLDGVPGAQFLQALKGLLENPLLILV
ncbi:MAG: 2-oxo acid dehydrogenase subunit E2 [Chthonomonadales bacterium]|nr:2-oxo acid dehydrogenase subunit E2 [Chthonomonadales bacterium]